MFEWLFGSGCPVDPQAKQWIEERLLWLRDEFGADDLYSNALILPTHEHFPDPYDGTRKAAKAIFSRVCDYMGVESYDVKLRFMKPAANPLFMVNESGEMMPTEAAGLFEPGLIRINDNELVDPMSLVGTMAHELAHQRLMGEDRIDRSIFDNELLTDLTVVFKGLGVFLANTPRHYDGNYTKWPGTDLRKPEYMTSPMFGYAIGLMAWLRNDTGSAWQSHLKFGVRGEFKQTIRFLTKTGDTALRRIGSRR